MTGQLAGGEGSRIEGNGFSSHQGKGNIENCSLLLLITLEMIVCRNFFVITLLYKILSMHRRNLTQVVILWLSQGVNHVLALHHPQKSYVIVRILRRIYIGIRQQS